MQMPNDLAVGPDGTVFFTDPFGWPMPDTPRSRVNALDPGWLRCVTVADGFWVHERHRRRHSTASTLIVVENGHDGERPRVRPSPSGRRRVRCSRRDASATGSRSTSTGGSTWPAGPRRHDLRTRRHARRAAPVPRRPPRQHELLLRRRRPPHPLRRRRRRARARVLLDRPADPGPPVARLARPRDVLVDHFSQSHLRTSRTLGSLPWRRWKTEVSTAAQQRRRRRRRRAGALHRRPGPARRAEGPLPGAVLEVGRRQEVGDGGERGHPALLRPRPHGRHPEGVPRQGADQPLRRVAAHARRAGLPAHGRAVGDAHRCSSSRSSSTSSRRTSSRGSTTRPGR